LAYSLRAAPDVAVAGDITGSRLRGGHHDSEPGTLLRQPNRERRGRARVEDNVLEGRRTGGAESLDKHVLPDEGALRTHLHVKYAALRRAALEGERDPRPHLHGDVSARRRVPPSLVRGLDQRLRRIAPRAVGL